MSVILKRRLNKLCKQLDSDYYINSGGCCYVAFLISKHLDKLGINYKLVIYDSEEINISEAKELTHSKNLFYNPITGYNTCNHYTLMIGRCIINSGNFRDKKKYVLDGISSSELKWIYDNGDWNNCFDSKKIVKRIINNFFKDYEKGRKS